MENFRDLVNCVWQHVEQYAATPQTLNIELPQLIFIGTDTQLVANLFSLQSSELNHSNAEALVNNDHYSQDSFITELDLSKESNHLMHIKLLIHLVREELVQEQKLNLTYILDNSPHQHNIVLYSSQRIKFIEQHVYKDILVPLDKADTNTIAEKLIQAYLNALRFHIPYLYREATSLMASQQKALLPIMALEQQSELYGKDYSQVARKFIEISNAVDCALEGGYNSLQNSHLDTRVLDNAAGADHQATQAYNLKSLCDLELELFFQERYKELELELEDITWRSVQNKMIAHNTITLEGFYPLSLFLKIFEASLSQYEEPLTRCLLRIQKIVTSAIDLRFNQAFRAFPALLEDLKNNIVRRVTSVANATNLLKDFVAAQTRYFYTREQFFQELNELVVQKEAKRVAQQICVKGKAYVLSVHRLLHESVPRIVGLHYYTQVSTQLKQELLDYCYYNKNVVLGHLQARVYDAQHIAQRQEVLASLQNSSKLTKIFKKYRELDDPITKSALSQSSVQKMASPERFSLNLSNESVFSVRSSINKSQLLENSSKIFPIIKSGNKSIIRFDKINERLLELEQLKKASEDKIASYNTQKNQITALRRRRSSSSAREGGQKKMKQQQTGFFKRLISIFTRDEKLAEPFSLNEWLVFLTRENSLRATTDNERLRASVRHGIPHRLRATIWLNLTQSRKVDLLQFKELSSRANEWEVQINKDLDRTGCGKNYSESIQNYLSRPEYCARESMFLVLRAYANIDQATGYTQGMNFLVLVLLSTFQGLANDSNIASEGQEELHKHLLLSEEHDGATPTTPLQAQTEAFQVLCYIMFDLKHREMLGNGTPQLVASLMQLDEFLLKKMPELHQVMESSGISSVHVFTQYYATIFTVDVPLSFAQSAIDCFIVEGASCITEMLINMLESCLSEILQLTELDRFFSFLRNELCPYYFNKKLKQ